MVLHVELPVADASEYLAWDEAFLGLTDSGGTEVLWFWESAVPFVVVGYGQHVEREVHVAACERQGIPVLRRCSGGGTVLQGPGCLNYGLTLRSGSDPALATISGANRFILERQCRALEPLAGARLEIQGHTDLVKPGPDGVPLKFSGNAQRRTRESLLFHGTLLLDMDLTRITDLLPRPSWEPPYRDGRNHASFVINTGLGRVDVRTALVREWDAAGTLDPLPWNLHRQAMDDRYGRQDWHRRR